MKSATIEVTSLCNLRCTICPLGNGMMARQRQIMEPETWTAALASLPAGLERLNLNNWGEPLLHPRLLSMLRQARGALPDCEIAFATNATRLDAEIGATLLAEGLVDEVQFSVDGGASEYEAIRGASYGDVVDNIRRFLDERERSGAPVRTVLKMVVSATTAGAADAVVAEWGARVDEVRLQAQVTYEPSARVGICGQLFNQHLVILSGGDVVPCCVDFDGTLAVGSALSDSLDTIWRGARMERLRAAHSRGRYPDICRRCTEWKGDAVEDRF